MSLLGNNNNLVELVTVKEEDVEIFVPRLGKISKRRTQNDPTVISQSRRKIYNSLIQTKWFEIKLMHLKLNKNQGMCERNDSPTKRFISSQSRL